MDPSHHILVNVIPETPSPLKVRHVPLPLTCGVFDDTIITDPSLLEEELVTTQVTVVSTADGKVQRKVLTSISFEFG